MRMLVLGAGLQGSACAYDLLQDPEVTEVRLADLHRKAICTIFHDGFDIGLLDPRLLGDNAHLGSMDKIAHRTSSFFNIAL